MDLIRNIMTVDTHTCGEPTRIIFAGFPYFSKTNMIEVKEEFEKNHDYIRKIVINEPRGHSGMFGAIVTPPTRSDCDIGAVFFDTGGYLNMCGHGSIGLAKFVIESNLVNKIIPKTKIKVDTPAGVINLEVNFYKEQIIENIVLTNVKSFNYLANLEFNIEKRKIIADIAFGGNFFAIIDADDIGLKISLDNIYEITRFGMKILNYLRKNVEVKHPEIEKIASVDLVEFNSSKNLHKNHNKNVVIFGNYQFDRSPCGTGTSAKLANLYFHKKIDIGEEFINESIIGTKFIGKILREDNTGKIKGIIPKIKANAFITGYNNFVVERSDTLGQGFSI